MRDLCSDLLSRLSEAASNGMASVPAVILRVLLANDDDKPLQSDPVQPFCKASQAIQVSDADLVGENLPVDELRNITDSLAVKWPLKLLKFSLGAVLVGSISCGLSMIIPEVVQHIKELNISPFSKSRRVIFKEKKPVDLDKYEALIADNIIDSDKVNVTFKDVGGHLEIIDELIRNVLRPLQYPHIFAQSGCVNVPKGILLYGPSGCGKTLIAKALACEAGCTFINLEIRTIVDKYYGEPQNRVAALFSLARKLQPAIIFVDEMDCFLQTRRGDDHESTTMIKSIFLTEWDGLNTDHEIQLIVIGSTNRPECIDPAFLRRMPLRLRIGMPERSSQREQILKVLTAHTILSPDVNLKAIADKTAGLSGSDLHEICRIAANNCIQGFIERCGVGSEAEAADSVSEKLEDVKIPPVSLEDFRVALEKFRQYRSITPGCLNAFPSNDIES